MRRLHTDKTCLHKSNSKVHLGSVDAFVSHSWHDDPEKKWTVLQQWREKFKGEHGREPKLWIDKYCIDQKHIDDSLACLPVYLAGCSKLLILCGSTYLKRLWCLVEIFVFLEMGGERSRLEVHLLGQGTRPSVASFASASSWGMSSARLAVGQFDARTARCFTDEDTIRLQKVIEVAGYSKIDQLVRKVFL